MYNFSEFDLHALFRVKDALEMLNAYSLADKEMLAEVNKEINEREAK